MCKSSLMKFLRKHSIQFMLYTLPPVLLGTTTACSEGHSERDLRVVATSQKTIDGRALTFVKKADAQGQTVGFILDEDGREVSPETIPHVIPSKLGKGLQAVFARGSVLPLVNVRIGLKVPQVDLEPTPVSSSHVIVDENGQITVTLNGVQVNEEAVEADNQKREARIMRNLVRLEEARREALRELGRRHPRLMAHPALGRAMERGDSSVVLPMDHAQIEELLVGSDDLISGLELSLRAVDTMSNAVQNTNVDPYAWYYYPPAKGDGIGIYMSEGGCPNPNNITNYTRLNGLYTQHSHKSAAVLRAVSPDAHIYCRDQNSLPNSADLAGTGGNPPIYVESNSWAGFTIENGVMDPNYLESDRDWDDHIYNTARIAFNSAGNGGSSYKYAYVQSPGRALNTITVGNYANGTDQISDSSSYRNSQMGNEKPELVAPGDNITLPLPYPLNSYEGTSCSTPHAAAFAANFMSLVSWFKLKPVALKAMMLAGAQKSISGGSDKVGVGGIDFEKVRTNWTVFRKTGNNGSFSTHDNADYLPGNGYWDNQVYLEASQSQVRVALAWLNRGTYLYDHQNDAHPIGMDLDLNIYDPNGNHIGSSSSWDNPFEVVTFDPTMTGHYRIAVKRFANRDTSSKLHMSVAVIDR